MIVAHYPPICIKHKFSRGPFRTKPIYLEHFFQPWESRHCRVNATLRSRTHIHHSFSLCLSFPVHLRVLFKEMHARIFLITCQPSRRIDSSIYNNKREFYRTTRTYVSLCNGRVMPRQMRISSRNNRPHSRLYSRQFIREPSIHPSIHCSPRKSSPKRIIHSRVSER